VLVGVIGREESAFSAIGQKRIPRCARDNNLQIGYSIKRIW
jgi:hypothetical protein